VVTRQLQVERGQGKFAGPKPTFYHCATQPTKSDTNQLHSSKCLLER